MEYYIRQVASLREEVVTTLSSLTTGILIIGALAVVAYIAYEATGKQALYRLMFVLVAGTLFFAAKNDYVAHRCSAWIELVEPHLAANATEIPVPPWEEWKKSRWGTKVLLPTLDVLMAVPLIWILLVSLFPGVANMSSDQFAWLAGTLIVMGIVSIPASVKLAGW